MEALGRHVLADMLDCDPSSLDQVDRVRDIMVEAAIAAGAEVREVAFHKFSPQGISGVVVISESHLAVHTWPEFGYAAVDVFTCGSSVDPWDAVNRIAKEFKAKTMQAREMKRGVLAEDPKQERAVG